MLSTGSTRSNSLGPTPLSIRISSQETGRSASSLAPGEGGIATLEDQITAGIKAAPTVSKDPMA